MEKRNGRILRIWILDCGFRIEKRNGRIRDGRTEFVGLLEFLEWTRYKLQDIRCMIVLAETGNLKLESGQKSWE